MIELLRVHLFAVRLLLLPDTVLTPATALEASAAMHQAARGDVTPAILAAITWRESRFTFTARTNPRPGRWCCGVTQLAVSSPRACRQLAARRFGVYPDTVAHLEIARGVCRRLKRGTGLECALAGYGHGMAGARRGTTKNARLVLRLARQIDRGAPAPPRRPGS